MALVLVVDDDALICQALSKVLESEGHTVLSHTDPRKALEEKDFAVVISDFMMPHVNGIELLAQVRKEQPQAVRLLLTAAADFKVAVDAVNRGEVFRLVAKPWALSELQSVIRQAIEHYHLVEDNRRLTDALKVTNDELLTMNIDLEQKIVERTNGLLEGMVAALDYRDTETQWHSRRVSLYSRAIAEAAGVRGTELKTVEQGALLHDIGKIGVRDSILLKPGPLTPEEWVEMKMHPDIGFRMLANIPYLKDASMIVHQHQEKFNGEGYPNRVKGQNIVLGSRIFVIADTLDAITSDRPYRKGRPLEVAKSEIERCIGTQFDPELVKLFLSLPDDTWLQIRRHVEQLEESDKKKWEGVPMLNIARPPPAS
ncbi:MAG: response regulator [Archangiaceae bacterium]|nr:response regulator [Archangiaceae bacterium]